MTCQTHQNVSGKSLKSKGKLWNLLRPEGRSDYFVRISLARKCCNLQLATYSTSNTIATTASAISTDANANVNHYFLIKKVSINEFYHGTCSTQWTVEHSSSWTFEQLSVHHLHVSEIVIVDLDWRICHLWNPFSRLTTAAGPEAEAGLCRTGTGVCAGSKWTLFYSSQWIADCGLWIVYPRPLSPREQVKTMEETWLEKSTNGDSRR